MQRTFVFKPEEIYCKVLEIEPGFPNDFTELYFFSFC